MGDISDEEMFEDGEEAETNRLFSQVSAPQEAVMDAMLIKHLCMQQAEQMSANIA